VISKELSREYLEKEFALTEKDHEAAQRRVRHMAEDMYRIYKAFANQDEGNKTQFITDVEVTPATRADAHELPRDSEAFRGVREEAAGAVCRCRVREWTGDTIFTCRVRSLLRNMRRRTGPHKR